jgi:hypothetical protein
MIKNDQDQVNATRIFNQHPSTMNHSIVLRRLLLAPPSMRASLIAIPPRTFTSAIPLPRTFASQSPSVVQKSFWVNMIPKPWRTSSPKTGIKKKAKSKEWNPATFFIVIFLLIGSMSIQMIALRNEFTATTRRADAKIGLLKEIIEKIQNGEEVDVEGLLGTGDKQREEEWEEGELPTSFTMEGHGADGLKYLRRLRRRMKHGKEHGRSLLEPGRLSQHLGHYDKKNSHLSMNPQS